MDDWLALMDDLLALHLTSRDRWVERAQGCRSDAADLARVGDAELAAIEVRAAELYEALASTEMMRYELRIQRRGGRP
jgi:hypothetical protein